ncbi:MAG: hypothetical protein R2828_32165 [Saprospiraceae bacterium]
MKPIGGFLEFDLPQIGASYHPQALALSTGRSCINYIIQKAQIKTCYIPFYSCDSVLSAFELNDVSIKFYEIDAQLEPKIQPELEEGAYLLYINFFGIKSATVARLIEVYGDRLIIDNVHLFFEKGYPNNWSFTSARKYFGVPDGAYVYPPTGIAAIEDFPKFCPTNIDHLVNRLIGDRELAYQQNVIYEETLSPTLQKMSTFSEKMLNTMDYDQVISIRQENFQWLHEHLSPYNQLIINVPPRTTCFRYPFLPPKQMTKGPFYEAQLFIPAFWSDVTARTIAGFEWEKHLSKALLPLPIDHRYRIKDLQRLLDFILTQILD